MKNIILIFPLITFFAIASVVAQDMQNVKRVETRFEKGQCICSETGNLNEGKLFVCDKTSIFNFVGVYTGIENSHRRDLLIANKGVVEVRHSDMNGKISQGDKVTISGNGVIIKAISDNDFVIGQFTGQIAESSPELLKIKLF